MYLLDEQLILSASDLNDYVQCRHLTHLNLAKLRGEAEPEGERDLTADLIAQKGDEHEAAFLATLRDDGKDIVEIEQGRQADALARAAAATEQAMGDGAEVIYQATFFRNGLRGHADFLFKVERPSALGDWSYEVADTKLARRTKPYFILQLCFYSELLAEVQGAEPERIHVILGTGEQHSYRLAEFSAYFRQVRGRFLADLAADVPDTYPEPVDHCAVCKWSVNCDNRRVADDHLSLVANLGSLHRRRLNEADVKTLTALAQIDPGTSIARVRDEMLERFRDQAALQLQGRVSGELKLRLLAPEPGRGFHRLPPTSLGDVFFDMEGDPFFEGGLEYLFGLVTIDTAEPQFTALWGTDPAEEKQAFEEFIDLVVERLGQWPDLHVYHYAHYEITALKRLAGAHATREAELDDLLRADVFVDLYKVVREGLRISQPSYGLKKVEAFYRDARDTEVTDGNTSVVEFERWLDSEPRDQSILDAIGDYNRDDCVSTYELREWLLVRRAEAGAEHGVEIGWEPPEESERNEEKVELDRETAELVERLLDGVPDDPDLRDDEQRQRALMAHLLEYHRREERPVWWAFFDRLDSPVEDLIDDAECVAELTPDQATEPWPVKKSLAQRLDFPPQETKVDAGDKLKDHATGGTGGEVIAIDRVAGSLDLKRGPGLKDVPLPRALIPGGPVTTPRQQAALRRIAESILATGLDGPGPYRAARDILLELPPRLTGREPGAPLQADSIELEEMKEIVRALDGGALFIQGPPGAGKTWSGARLIVDLIARGNRVGVAATGHRAICTLLAETEAVAVAEGVELLGVKKATSTNPDSFYDSPRGDDALIGNATKNEQLIGPEVRLAAGTAWLQCDEIMDSSLDYLFIDEAGQISLADALAMSTASRNVVLLGDPQQLPQVTQGRHPEGAGCSVLTHLLGDRQTVPPERGLFLDRSFRMHPEVASFVSEIMYEGRLGSAENCAAQRIDAPGELSGTGLRWIPVEHEANSQESPEEVERVVELVAGVRGGTWTNADGESAPIDLYDILVVSPYNAQVRALARALPGGARVGTVDKFQGQEAAAVIFSMATSSSAELPRNLEFLFSRNRLNVAISRARCLAGIVASPLLLETDCRTIEQMRLVNALCRAAEAGRGPMVSDPSGPAAGGCGQS
jgi:uncharacterized protein